MSADEVRRSYLRGYSKQELVTIVLSAQERAKEHHQRARKAELKLSALEAEVALYRAKERGDS